MHTVSSADGTTVAYERHGEGKPLILIHGSSGSRTHWDPLCARLREEFTLIVPDRRGRGDSADANGYSLEREVADLAALVDTLAEDPIVFGHSFGGLVALAGACDHAIERLPLYEPALLVGEHRGEDLSDRMRKRLDDGRRLEALRLFIEESGDVSDVERLPWWPEEAPVDQVDTIIREADAIESFRLEDQPQIEVPTLLLTGEDGPSHLRDAIFRLEAWLPENRLVELEDVGHVGTQSAPDRVADAVRSFVREG